MKLLVVAPHLSTGGMPQYLLKYLEIHKDLYAQIKVVEFSNFSLEFVVQKNKIKDLIGEENLITLGEYLDWETDYEIYLAKRNRLIDIIEEFQPDVVYMSSTPECYEYKLPPDEIMEKVYREDRKYKIIETNHNNSFDFRNKRFIPDEFMFCSNLHMDKTSHIDIPKTVWEYPIEIQERPDREKVLTELGLDPSYLHVLNVGLINPNKNQKYIFELAKKLKNQKIQFHFIGNNCFLDNCDIPLEDISRSNCKIWGERNDVDKFMSCMDIYLFPSKKELNPLTIKEALSWNMEVIANEDENYTHQYKEYSNFHLIGDIVIEGFINREYGTMVFGKEISHDSLEDEEYSLFKHEIENSIYLKIYDVEDGDVVVDLGACIGTFSLEAIKKNIKKCYCVEPSKIHFEDLKKNINDDRCVIINKGVGNKNERNITEFNIGGYRKEEVDIVTLKRLSEICGIDKIDFLKMDIEGHEYNVLLHQESYDWIKNNVNKFTGELHLAWKWLYNDKNVECSGREDLRRVIDKLNRDFILNIASIDGIDITDLFINNSYLINGELPWDYYTEVIFYAKNKKDVKGEIVTTKNKFLVVCSFYNNTREQIRQTFDNIIKQTYDNWVLIVGDDFSDNNCKNILKEDVDRINHPNILYYDIRFKRELYLYQNFFKTIKYDYYLDLDSDDIIDDKLLEVYNYHFNLYPEIFSIFCDNNVISVNGQLERLSLIKYTGDDSISEFNIRHGSTYNGIWSKYHSWNMYGAARCFRKSCRDSFPISKKCKSSTDSFVLFSCLNEGNHLNLPRNLYSLVRRDGSDSSGSFTQEERDNYNVNAFLAMEGYGKYGVLDIYDDVWIETSAISTSNFIKERESINLITNISNDQLTKIKSLYYDNDIFINDSSKNNLVIVWNKLTDEQKIGVLRSVVGKKYVIYNFLDNFNKSEYEVQNYFTDELCKFVRFLQQHISGFSYFHYFRHIVITGG